MPVKTRSSDHKLRSGFSYFKMTLMGELFEKCTGHINNIESESDESESDENDDCCESESESESDDDCESESESDENDEMESIERCMSTSLWIAKCLLIGSSISIVFMHVL
jgi:hypothetical protein